MFITKFVKKSCMRRYAGKMNGSVSVPAHDMSEELDKRAVSRRSSELCHGDLPLGHDESFWELWYACVA